MSELTSASERDTKAVEAMAHAAAFLVCADLEGRSVLPVRGIIDALDSWDHALGKQFREAFKAKMLDYANRVGRVP